jgi:hypothetical protein
MQTLFHYTTAPGLLGILRDGSPCLWATDLRFLSDAEEAIYAERFFVDSLRAMENPALDPSQPAHQSAGDFGTAFEGYRELVIDALRAKQFPVYVTCFCESGDLLSQWRGYGSDHGYAIEFNRDALAELALPPYDAPNLVRVRYGDEAAKDVLDDALKHMRSDANLGHPGVHSYYMARDLTSKLATIKHPGFSEEREWRLIATFEADDPALVRFRATPVAVAPYIELRVPTDAVISIRVGPGRHVDVRSAGVQRLLARLGRDVPVLQSEVPLRS